MDLGDLVTALEKSRIPLRDVPFSRVRARLGGTQVGNYRGAAVEAMVEYWLSRTERVTLDTNMHRTADNFQLVQQRGCIVVRNRSGKPQCEFDIVVFYGNLPVIVEVKSGGLNGFARKISRHLGMGRRIYGPDVGLLIALPFRREDHYRELEQRYGNNVRFVDIRYGENQPAAYMRKLEQWLSAPGVHLP